MAFAEEDDEDFGFLGSMDDDDFDYAEVMGEDDDVSQGISGARGEGLHDEDYGFLGSMDDDDFDYAEVMGDDEEYGLQRTDLFGAVGRRHLPQKLADLKRRYERALDVGKHPKRIAKIKAKLDEAMQRYSYTQQQPGVSAGFAETEAPRAHMASVYNFPSGGAVKADFDDDDDDDDDDLFDDDAFDDMPEFAEAGSLASYETGDDEPYGGLSWMYGAEDDEDDEDDDYGFLPLLGALAGLGLGKALIGKIKSATPKGQYIHVMGEADKARRQGNIKKADKLEKIARKIKNKPRPVKEAIQKLNPFSKQSKRRRQQRKKHAGSW